LSQFTSAGTRNPVSRRPLSLAASKGKLELPEEFVQPVVEVAPDEPESTVVDGV